MQRCPTTAEWRNLSKKLRGGELLYLEKDVGILGIIHELSTEEVDKASRGGVLDPGSWCPSSRTWMMQHPNCRVRFARYNRPICVSSVRIPSDERPERGLPSSSAMSTPNCCLRDCVALWSGRLVASPCKAPHGERQCGFLDRHARV